MSTQDLFYIVSSIATVWLVVFITWVLFRLAELLKETHYTIQNLNTKLDMVDEWVESARERMAHATSMLSVVTQSVKAAMAVVERLKWKQSGKKTAKNSQKISEEPAE